jgi:DNA-binding response OmpR family regulator
MDRKGHILLVEIDDLMRELMERWLGEAGYTVIAAGHGAMHALPPANTPCLVIVNAANPRVAQRLVPLLGKYAAPILIVSGRFRGGLSAEAAHRLGARKVLPKPFTRKELLIAVHELLEAAK